MAEKGLLLGKGFGGGSSIADNTTEPNFPYKKAGAFEDSNLSQDPDGKLRATTQIVAEQGIDTIQNTIELGDGLGIGASGPQQVNKSKVTGVKYQIPYQELDKTGTQKTVEIEVGPEAHAVRQPVDDTILSPGVPFVITSPSNDIINAVFFKSNGTLTNFRYKVVSVTTGEIVDRYPDKFKYEKGEGIELTGAAIHKIDLYFVEGATPDRFLQGQQFEVTLDWDTGVNALLGRSDGIAYYEYDFQLFEFKNIATEEYVDNIVSGLTDGRFLGKFADLTALQTAYPTGNIGDTATVVSPNNNMFFWNNDTPAWEDSGTGYVGDMLKAVYDPSGKAADAFSMGNMEETSSNKVLTNIERQEIAANTGKVSFPEAPVDGDLYARKDGAWEKVPSGGTVVNKMTIEPTSNIENLDVSSLSPLGVLFVNNASNRELRSLAGGVDGDIIHLIHLSLNNLKIKNPDSYSGQSIATPGDADRTLMDYGGCTLVYSSLLGYWVATGLYY